MGAFLFYTPKRRSTIVAITVDKTATATSRTKCMGIPPLGEADTPRLVGFVLHSPNHTQAPCYPYPFDGGSISELGFILTVVFQAGQTVPLPLLGKRIRP